MGARPRISSPGLFIASCTEKNGDLGQVEIFKLYVSPEAVCLLSEIGEKVLPKAGFTLQGD